jgi:hypothetical protein
MANIQIPYGAITNAEISASAAIAASKVVHRECSAYGQAIGSVVAAATMAVRVARTSGAIKEFRVAWLTAPTGGDKAFTVDLQLSTGGGAFATCLSAVVTVNNTKSDNGTATGTLTTTTFATGDILKVVVATSGSTGTQGYGMIAEVFCEEGE